MYQQQHPQQGQSQHRQYRTDWYDQSTLLNGLPNSNNVTPQIAIHQALPQNVAWLVAGELRTFFQNALSKGPVQIGAYNMVSENHFNNPVFTSAVQTGSDLTAFLMMNQRLDFDTARRKAVRAVYMGHIAMSLALHPHLQQQVAPQFIQETQEAAGLYRQAMADAQSVWQQQQQQVGYPPQQAGYPPQHQGGYIQQPPPLMQPQGGYNQGYQTHVPPPHHQMATQQGHHQGGPRMASGQVSQPTVGPTVTDTGRYSTVNYSVVRPEDNQRQPGHPVQSFTTGPQPTAPQPTQAPVDNSAAAFKPPSFNNYDGAITPAEPKWSDEQVQDLDVFIGSTDDLIFDPEYHIPDGVTIDKDRPYDVIYAPQGIKMVPAFLSKEQPTKNDLVRYASGYQPDLYCMYHVFWPDGNIEEIPYEWKDGMEYLKHQLIQELKGVDVADGKVIPSSRVINRTETTPVKSSVLLNEDIDHRHLKKNPVAIEGIFTTSSIMEDEELAQQHLIDILDLKPNDTIPAHIYTTVQEFPLNVSEDCVDRLYLLAASDELPEVAQGLRKALKDGVLPLREFRLINDRFTQRINLVLHDNLSLDDIRINSFVHDIAELIDILREEEEYTGMLELLEVRTSWILDRVMSLRTDEPIITLDAPALMDEDEEVESPTDGEDAPEGEEEDEDDDSRAKRQTMLVDTQVNYRVGFNLEEIVALQVEDEPVLLSQASMPRLHTLIYKFSAYYKDTSRSGATLQIITADGVYLEVITGWLNDGSILIKRKR